MRRLFIQCGLFFFFLFVSDKAFLVVRAYAPTVQDDPRLVKVMSGELTADILVVGSSRGVTDIATWTLAKELGYSAFNVSFVASTVEVHDFVFTNYVAEQEAPDILIKIIDVPFEFKSVPTNGWRWDLFYPLVKYKAVRNLLVEQGEKDWLLSKLFITHQLSKSAYDPRPPVALIDTVRHYGNLPQSGTGDSILTWVSTTTQYDTTFELKNKIAAFTHIQDLATQKGTQVVFAIPPSFVPYDDAFTERVRKLIQPPHRLFVYDESDPEMRNPSNFFDTNHLNKRGAEYFTEALLRFIKTES